MTHRVSAPWLRGALGAEGQGRRAALRDPEAPCGASSTHRFPQSLLPALLVLLCSEDENQLPAPHAQYLPRSLPVWEQNPPQRGASEHRVEFSETGERGAHGPCLLRERTGSPRPRFSVPRHAMPRWASPVLTSDFLPVVPLLTTAYLGRTFLLVS